MSPNRKLLGAAAFTLALTGGGVAGALLGTPNLSNAQDGTTSISTSASSATADEHAGRPFERRGEGLAVAAKALGMSAADLRSALEGGKSIAQVATDQGVDLQTVIDALVADGTARLKALEASLPDRVNTLVNRTGWGEHGQGEHGPGGPGGDHHGFRGLQAAADAIGISADDLRTALEGGSTVADVAKAHNVELQKVIDALVADATTHIDEAVANGRIDAARTAEMKANLVERITARVNGTDPGGPDGPPPAGDSLG
ncbi:MAG: hypothetical protein ABIY48_08185 [Acidimicrobiales bacterium]